MLVWICYNTAQKVIERAGVVVCFSCFTFQVWLEIYNAAESKNPVFFLDFGDNI